jgi:hypothetical protein
LKATQRRIQEAENEKTAFGEAVFSLLVLAENQQVRAILIGILPPPAPLCKREG